MGIIGVAPAIFIEDIVGVILVAVPEKMGTGHYAPDHRFGRPVFFEYEARHHVDDDATNVWILFSGEILGCIGRELMRCSENTVYRIVLFETRRPDTAQDNPDMSGPFGIGLANLGFGLDD